MFDKEYFLNEMRHGVSLDTIAEGIAAAMNEAKEAFEAELEAEAQAQAAIEQDRYKREIAMDMIDLIREYGHLVAPEAGEILDNVSDEDVDMMIQTLDEMFKMMRAMSQLKVDLEKIADHGSKSDDEVLSNFIASLM